jgi:hypothetical protein
MFMITDAASAAMAESGSPSQGICPGIRTVTVKAFEFPIGITPSLWLLFLMGWSITQDVYSIKQNVYCFVWLCVRATLLQAVDEDNFPKCRYKKTRNMRVFDE